MVDIRQSHVQRTTGGRSGASNVEHYGGYERIEYGEGDEEQTGGRQSTVTYCW